MSNRTETKRPISEPAAVMAVLMALAGPALAPPAHAQQAGFATPRAKSEGSTSVRRGVIEEIGNARVVQGSVRIERRGASDALVAGATILRLDRLATGAGARVQLAFRDGSFLVLGENAELVVDDYVYRPARGSGSLLLEMVKGAFRFTTGKIGLLEDKRIEVRMPAATLAVRGTALWGGPIDGGTGVLVFKGVVQVRTLGGSVLLNRKRQGTMIRGAGAAPERPVIWPREKLERALVMVALRP